MGVSKEFSRGYHVTQARCLRATWVFRMKFQKQQFELTWKLLVCLGNSVVMFDFCACVHHFNLYSFFLTVPCVLNSFLVLYAFSRAVDLGLCRTLSGHFLSKTLVPNLMSIKLLFLSKA